METRAPLSAAAKFCASCGNEFDPRPIRAAKGWAHGIPQRFIFTPDPMFSQKLLRFVSALTALAFMTGCAGMSDRQKTVAQGTGIGAVLGAVVGGAIGYAAGGESGLARGAVIGAGVGAYAGHKYGTHVANLKARYASREAWLDACIASAHRVNANAYAYSRNLDSRIARLESRSRTARATRNKSEMRRIRTEVAQLKTQAKGQNAAVQQELGAQRTAVNEGRGAKNYGGLQSEVKSLEQTQGTLGKQINRLAGIENQTDV